ncbi:sugar phosphate nucleotidyltransferase [Niallia sp. FSL W8-0954]|uniref:sugar phosphate nucleotidyltransferase n=1 Tax=Niallia sp. FSL W8-0954 TaxID=2975338 RepID=UPI0030FC7C8F
MKLVLLSGGSGKRLWPLSNDARSKQFLKVLEDKNNRVSMVQRVYKQLKNVGLDKSVVIATSASQVDMIRNQLENKVPIVVEPERRDTFPAIALSASYLYSKCSVDRDEVVGILPVDPYVEDAFFLKVAELESAVKNTESDLALIGVKPTFPSSKYGYIVPSNANSEHDCLQVSHFKEKPSELQAKELIDKGALWNCGVFAFKLSFILNIIEGLGLSTNYEELKKQYDLINKNSFDYEVVEKANKIVAIDYNGYWKDLGTWNTLTEEMTTNIMGIGTISEDSENVHLINELEIPVAVLGGKNLIVAASPDGILVSDKESSPKLKDLITDFNQRPMYEERIWGWYKVLDFSKYDKKMEVLTKKICINAGKNLSYHYHQHRVEVWTIIKGSGELIMNNESRAINAGDVIEISPYIKHALRAIEDLEIIEIQKGTNIVEEDIKDPIFSWNEILLDLKI